MFVEYVSNSAMRHFRHQGPEANVGVGEETRPAHRISEFGRDEFIDVTPHPTLAGFDGADQRMT